MKRTLHIAGMSCAHCEKRVKTALAAKREIGSVTIDLQTGTATVELQDELDHQTLIAIVEEAGYDVTSID